MWRDVHYGTGTPGAQNDAFEAVRELRARTETRSSAGRLIQLTSLSPPEIVTPRQLEWDAAFAAGDLPFRLRWQSLGRTHFNVATGKHAETASP